MRWLSLAEVLELHRRLIEQTGGMPGLRDLGLLESSLAQPHQSFGGVDLYPGLNAKAAALGLPGNLATPTLPLTKLSFFCSKDQA